MEFLSRTDNIRNICILAHVDHGKTTIADSLIASNGIISQRMAGKMRYLDNRQDEQERGITMKSSSIALKFTDEIGSKFLINLVDTPGHVDFCGEVSAAVRLCDGALIVVDVVEGVCPQTKVALEQAWKEGIKPILVLNKIDRMVLEQKLDETAAYLRLSQILEEVNAIVGTLVNTEFFEDEATAQSESAAKQQLETRSRNNSETKPSNETSSVHVYDWASAIEDIDDDKYYFMPEKDNVVFSSSIDDWAFTVSSFSKQLAARHKINQTALQKTLWGDFYIDMKQRKIQKNVLSKGKKNLFTSMVLENIWKVYDTVCVRRDTVRMTKICEVLGVNLTQRDINHTDSRYQTKLIMSRWLHLASNTLDSVSKIVPSPSNLSEKRIERLLSSNQKRFHQLPAQSQSLKEAFFQCSCKEDAVKVACISKMIAIERKNLPENRKPIIRKVMVPPVDMKDNHQVSKLTENNSDECDRGAETVFIAFARVFSGTFKRGDKVYVLGPRHDPASVTTDTAKSIDESKRLDDLEIHEHVSIATIENCYLFMGRDIEPIEEALAGNIVGIRGLDSHLIRTATLSSDLYCPPFNDLHLPAAPILRVAIEPVNPLDMSHLVKGLKLLNQADPCVEVRLQQTGEHVIVATGEVHLEHCIKDLRERYTNEIEINVSPPIVPFRETLVLPLKKQSEVELLTPNKKCRIKMKATPMPDEMLKFLQEGVDKKKTNLFKGKLAEVVKQCRQERYEWRHLYEDDVVDRIWSFGAGTNILIGPQTEFSQDLLIHRDSFISGFQLATQSGPLCEEPMMGVCFFILDWCYTDQEADHSGLMSGQIISTVKESCRKAFQNQHQRLMWPMFSCDIQVKEHMLGKMYAVLGRRNGRILHGDRREGSGTFEVKAFIPVIESLDFVGEIRKQTSGMANPQLIFSHYEIIDIDPFWTPKTEEEYELYGDKADTENQALKYMNLVRRRKGLSVQEKIVEHGEKQRTIKRNK